jgi:hypothetical protein
MLESWALWAIGAAVGIISALVAVIYTAGQHRDDKQDQRFEMIESMLEKHVETMTAFRERLRAEEIETQVLKTEVAGLRDRWHDMTSETRRALTSWYSSIMEQIHKARPKDQQ